MADNNTFFGRGIPLASGFDLGAKAPLDARLVANTIEERDAHVTGNRAYPGLIVYVISEDKTYQYNGTEWKEFGVGGGETAAGDSHEHDNKDVLDQITQDHIESWNAKSNFSGNYEDLQGKPVDHVTTGMLGAELANYATKDEIPSVDGLATETFVRNAIAEAELNGGDQEVDLSGYATKDELSYKADRTELHQHANKDDLDKIDAARMALWDAKSDFDGDYNSLENLPEIPSIEGLATQDAVDLKADKTALDAKADISMLDAKADVSMLDAKADKTDLHTHSNKAVLDQIDDAKIASWDEKSNFTGSYKDLTDTPEIPSIEGLATEAFVKDEVANLVDSAPETLNTLNELAAALKDDASFATTVSNQIGLKADKTDLDGKVDKIEGKSLVDDEEIERLSKVDNYDDSEIREALNAKVEQNDLVGFATKEEVNAKANQTDVDNALGLKADKTDLHTHNNKAVLDKIDDAKIAAWDEKSEFSGSYNDLTDKPEIPSIEGLAKSTDLEPLAKSEDVNQALALKADKSELHNHENADALAQINQDQIDAWNAKSNFSGKYEDLEGKPTDHVTTGMLSTELESYASKEYVTEEIAKAKLEGEEVDLSGFVTDSELADAIRPLANQADVDATLALKADKSELHNHENKEALDGINAEKIAAWDNKAEADHNHDEDYAAKADLDGKVDKVEGKSLIADTEIARLAELQNYDDSELRELIDGKANSGDLHSHANKAVLDNIDAAKVAAWDSKSEFSGSYTDLTDTPEIPSIEGLAKSTDLEPLAKKEDVDQALSLKADKTDLHEHENKDALDQINQDLIDSWNAKSNFSGKYEDLEGKPTDHVTTGMLSTELDNYGTKGYIDEAIQKAQLESDGANLEIFVTDEELSTAIKDKANTTDVDNALQLKADKTDLHEHANKDLLDALTAEKITAWDNKAAGDHNHDEDYAAKADLDKKVDKLEGKSLVADTEIARLAELQNYDDTDVKNRLVALEADTHEHANKQVLDNIDAAKVAAWDEKSEFSGSYNDLEDLPVLFSGSFNDLSDVPEEIVMVDEMNTALDVKADKADLDLKVDKVEGKSLVADTEIARLANVDNYDDTDVKERLETLEADTHEHANKQVLDGIDAAKVAAWDSKSEFSGSYNELTEKPDLTVYETKEEVSKKANQSDVDAALELKADKTDLHTHANKEVLDNINADRVTLWDNKATTEYVDTKIGDLVGQAPDTLNALNELAQALGNDPNFATTMTNTLATKADKTDLEGLATENYVNNKITEAQLPGGSLDMTGLATKDELQELENLLATKADVPAKDPAYPTLTLYYITAVPTKDTTVYPDLDI